MWAGCGTGESGERFVDVACDDAIDAVDDLGGLSYAAHGSDGGFVALPSGHHQLGRSGQAGTDLEGFRFSKFGLLVRRDRIVSLEVVRAPGEAVLDYGHAETPLRGVRVGPCRSDREWVVFAGGVWVTEPGCVELAAASGETASVRVGVGLPCDGE